VGEKKWERKIRENEKAVKKKLGGNIIREKR